MADPTPKSEPHWTELAERVTDKPLGASNWFVGLMAENEDGMWLLPSWGNPHRDEYPGGWWGRSLDLRRPTHWLPYLRSRLTRKLVWVEAAAW